MALAMLLASFLGLVLHLLAGACHADVVDDDLTNLQAFFYTNHYLNLSDSKAIVALAEKGQCMSYTGYAKPASAGLASCELHCYLSHYNTWDCTAPAIDDSNLDWDNIYTDEYLFQWSPGTCSCSNSSSPSPDPVDGGLPGSLAKGFTAAGATREVREVSSYGYELGSDFDMYDPVPGWTFWSINLPQGQSDYPRSILIGIFGVPTDDSNPHVLRISETWASHDERDPSQRAFMHDTILGFWRLDPLNRNLDDLQQVRFDGIIEPTINGIVFDVYNLMGAREKRPLTVTRGGTSEREQEAFRLIVTTAKFAKRIQQATEEYDGFRHRTIEAFHFTEAWVGFSFAILLDGYDPSTVGDSSWSFR